MKKRITLALHLLVVLYAFFSMMYWAKAQEGISYHNLRLDGGFAAQHIGTLATCDLEPCVSRRAAKAKAQLDGPATTADLAPKKQRVVSGRPDPLGLERKSVELENLIPAVVGEAVSMNQVGSYYSGLFRSYGIGSFSQIPVYDQYVLFDPHGDLGRGLQREAQAKLYGLKYAALLPRTGDQAKDRGIVTDEFARSDEELRKPEFVIVLAYGILNESNSGTILNGPEMARMGTDIASIEGWNSKWVRRISTIVGSLGTMKTKRETEALLAVSFYDAQGEMVKHVTAAEKLSYDVARSVAFGGIYKVDTNNPSTLPFAKRLVDAAFAKMK